MGRNKTRLDVAAPKVGAACVIDDFQSLGRSSNLDGTIVLHPDSAFTHSQTIRDPGETWSVLVGPGGPWSVLELRGLPGLRGLQRLPGLPGLELRGERVGLSFLFLDDGSLAGRLVGRVG